VKKIRNEKKGKTRLALAKRTGQPRETGEKKKRPNASIGDTAAQRNGKD